MRAADRTPLHTRRLTLRPLTERDAAALFAIHADREAMRYWSGPPWQDDAPARRMIARDADPAQDDYLRLGIESSASGELIGACTLFEIVPQCRRAELGYILASTAWGHGYMQEALAAFIQFGFDTFDLHRIEADTDPRNEASKRLLQRLHFVQEGHFRERWVVDGEVSDSAMFGLLRRDWPGLQTR